MLEEKGCARDTKNVRHASARCMCPALDAYIGVFVAAHPRRTVTRSARTTAALNCAPSCCCLPSAESTSGSCTVWR